MMPHSFSVRLEPDDACWIAAPAAVMAVQQSNFHAPCCEACGKEWVKTVPTAESDPFVMVFTELHVQPPERNFGKDALVASRINKEQSR